MFSSVHYSSFPAHVFSIGAPLTASWTSQVSCRSIPAVKAPIAAGGAIHLPATQPGKGTKKVSSRRQFPCYDFPTLVDSLDNAGIAWKYYAPPERVQGYIFPSPGRNESHSRDKAVA
jgi:hypothetical protein